jgi:hypothetical protein
MTVEEEVIPVGSGMIWTPEQSRALDLCGDWLRDSDEQEFRLFGYAGPGRRLSRVTSPRSKTG